jgi:hypothetical protein
MGKRREERVFFKALVGFRNYKGFEEFFRVLGELLSVLGEFLRFRGRIFEGSHKNVFVSLTNFDGLYKFDKVLL